MKLSVFINVCIVGGVFLMTGCGDTEDEVNVANAKYYKPSQSICQNSGGLWNDQGMNECKADLVTAKSICQMPTDAQWEEVISDCGYTDYHSDDHDQYLACIEKSGYQWAGAGYWSSSLYSNPSYQDVLGNYVSFYSGDISGIGVETLNFVRCSSGGKLE